MPVPFKKLVTSTTAACGERALGRQLLYSCPVHEAEPTHFFVPSSVNARIRGQSVSSRGQVVEECGREVEDNKGM
jgi:hypothetical protein